MPLHNRSQKAAASGAPGSRQAKPIMATSGVVTVGAVVSAVITRSAVEGRGETAVSPSASATVQGEGAKSTSTEPAERGGFSVCVGGVGVRSGAGRAAPISPVATPSAADRVAISAARAARSALRPTSPSVREQPNRAFMSARIDFACAGCREIASNRVRMVSPTAPTSARRAIRKSASGLGAPASPSVADCSASMSRRCAASSATLA